MFLPTGIFRRQRRTQCLCGKSNLERFRNSARDNKQPAHALVNSMDPGYLAEESLAIQASGCTAFLQWVVTISEMGGVPQHSTYIGTYIRR